MTSNAFTENRADKRIGLVYNSEISGFQAIDFTKIDDIESILRNGIDAKNLNQLTYSDLLAPSGVVVYQANLNKDLDNITSVISGDALNYLSGLVFEGISLKGLNTVNVNVTGGSLNILNEVEIKNESDNPIPVSGVININNVSAGFDVYKGAYKIIPIFSTNPGGVSAELSTNNPFPVSGPLTDTQLRANAVPVSGTVTANVPLSSDIWAGNQGIRVVGNGSDGGLRIGGIDPLGGGQLNLEEGGGIPVFAVNQQALPISGTVTSKTEKSSTISNSAPGSSNGTVLNSNADRKELYIQNLATGVLYVKYGADASSSSFNFVLAANTATNAGDGGSLSDQAYTGIVSVSGAVGPSYISWERS